LTFLSGVSIRREKQKQGAERTEECKKKERVTASFLGWPQARSLFALLKLKQTNKGNYPDPRKSISMER